jgi:hypothetical protein
LGSCKDRTFSSSHFRDKTGSQVESDSKGRPARKAQTAATVQIISLTAHEAVETAATVHAAATADEEAPEDRAEAGGD